jgi:hypothetical protein
LAVRGGSWISWSSVNYPQSFLRGESSDAAWRAVGDP